ncbi:conserved hypothetical protein [Ricinus communis]|uniref:Uncharacterized protein n=1 Tax=Ricinus communis TaxID=3988 RepID=B9RQB6_RICCO|nr:conserved hypothetical protein [Ricinus communis]
MTAKRLINLFSQSQSASSSASHFSVVAPRGSAVAITSHHCIKERTAWRRLNKLPPQLEDGGNKGLFDIRHAIWISYYCCHIVLSPFISLFFFVAFFGIDIFLNLMFKDFEVKWKELDMVLVREAGVSMEVGGNSFFELKRKVDSKRRDEINTSTISKCQIRQTSSL